MTYIFLTILCRQNYVNASYPNIREIALSDMSELGITNIQFHHGPSLKSLRLLTGYKSINRFFLSFLRICEFQTGFYLGCLGEEAFISAVQKGYAARKIGLKIVLFF